MAVNSSDASRLMKAYTFGRPIAGIITPWKITALREFYALYQIHERANHVGVFSDHPDVERYMLEKTACDVRRDVLFNQGKGNYMRLNALSAGACLAALGLSSSCFSQSVHLREAPAVSTVSAPVTMTECEGTNNCATWTFLGTQGNGQWPSGEVANLSVEKFDADSVVIRRADSTGAAAGLTAVYRGTRHGDRIGGEFSSSWPGHRADTTGNWYATMGKSALSIPSVMRVCNNPNDWSRCSDWIWKGSHYEAWREWGVDARVTVESFTKESVVLRRTDYGAPGAGGGGGAGFSAVYRGSISSTGDTITDGVVTKNNDGSPSAFKAYWGTTLQGLPPAKNPATDAHRAPVVVGRPIICYPWFFSVVCQ